MKEIYFNCPSCRRSCVVDRSAAGYVAPCPHCSAQVRIPTRSRLPPHYVRWAATFAAHALVAAGVTGAVLFVAARKFQPESPAVIPEPVPAAARPAPVASPVRVETGWTAEQERLVQENQSIRMQFETLGNWVLKNFRGKYPLPERMVTRLRLPPVNDDYTLQADVAELLQVTPSEQALVNDALGATWRSIAQMESSLLSVTQSAPGKVTLHIPPYAEQGAAVREDLLAALETTLGTHRTDRFLDVTEEELQKSYHYFGAASRTLIFEVTTPADRRLPQYLVIKDGWILPQGESGRSYQVTETAVNRLPKPYLAYLGVLPPDVAVYAR